jgi:nitrite reductase (NO-forming)
MTPATLTRETDHQVTSREPPPNSGWSMGSIMVAILVPGLAVLAGLTIWAAGQPARSPAAPVVPPALAKGAGSATGAAVMADMPGMKSVSSTKTSAAPSTTAVAPGAAASAIASHAPRDATLPPVGPGTIHHYTITLKDEVLDIAPGVRFTGWTFEGSAPGPVIHVRQGDMVDITLVNGGAIPHSIDFHAALTAPNVSFASVPAGGRLHFRFRADTPGAFMYHCGTPPVLAHIANGMYGAIIVDPKGGLPPVAKSVVLVSGEWYLTGDGRTTPATLDFDKARAMQPDYVTFNGYAGQYKDNPLTANPGDTLRFYVVDAGPSLNTDFHVVGAILDRVYLDGTTTDVLHGVQTQLVPPGGGMVFDVKFANRGIFPFVSHSFAAVDMGEVGLVNVGNVPGTMSH